MKYRKKPVIIEACKWDGSNVNILYPWYIEAVNEGRIFHSVIDNKKLMIDTLEGKMYANPGDWIIQGVKGEIYPCKPDIFEATYEKVEE